MCVLKECNTYRKTLALTNFPIALNDGGTSPLHLARTIGDETESGERVRYPLYPSLLTTTPLTTLEPDGGRVRAVLPQTRTMAVTRAAATGTRHAVRKWPAARKTISIVNVKLKILSLPPPYFVVVVIARSRILNFFHSTALR